MKHYKVTSVAINYGVAKTAFTHYRGFQYVVGHISVQAPEFGREGIIDLVPVPPLSDYLDYAGVNFLSLDSIEVELRTLIQADHPKRAKYETRLRKIEAMFV